MSAANAEPTAPLSPTALMAVDGVSKRFGPVTALNDVSVRFAAGEVTALLGENGAGKSTLLKIMTGAYQADGGSIVMDGSPVSLASPHDSKKLGIRVIAQEPEILQDVNVAENIFIGALRSPRGLFTRRLLAERAARLIADLGFDAVLSPTAAGSSLSPAQRQLVEICRGLAANPRVVAFDEPTSSLTGGEVEALFRVIQDLRERGVAVVYVSHRMPEIFAIASKVAVLRDGQLVGVRSLEATDEGELVRMMVGRDLSTLFRRQRRTSERVVLEVDGLSNSHVHDVSFTIRAGEVVAVAGLIGAGRSELARTIVGDLPHTEGRVLVEGSAVVLRSPADAVRAGIGLAPEERKAQALLLARSVRDNTSLAVISRLSRWHVVDRKAERALVQEQVSRMNVRTPSLEQEVGKLSGGNQQKVVLARWLSRRPKVLILDEPTRGIDVGAKAEIYAIIDELAAEGMAILVISSELPEVLGLADRILTMEGGRLTGEIAGEDATEEKVLALVLPRQSRVPASDDTDDDARVI